MVFRESDMGILEIKDMSLSLNGKKILKNMNIDFWQGHVHAVVGPNGAGKSTLAATIAGLTGYTDFEGDIIYNNESIKNMRLDERAQKGITLAWQEPARFEGLTVRQFIRAASHDSNDNIEH
ncbi:MAG: ATP-binding cassette domain-containing protein, partial [candidate division Zixibacteria bacterium]|nr:ATP-binding cassette domain-containing protein [candidate division Zixibacteria bacterium]